MKAEEMRNTTDGTGETPAWSGLDVILFELDGDDEREVWRGQGGQLVEDNGGADEAVEEVEALQALAGGGMVPALRRFADARRAEAEAAARQAAGLEDGGFRYRLAPVGAPSPGVPVAAGEPTEIADLDPEIGRLIFGDLYDRAVALRAQVDERRARGEEPTTYVILRTSERRGVDLHGDEVVLGDGTRIVIDEVRLMGVDIAAPPPPSTGRKSQREIERENLNAVRARGRRWPRRRR